MEPILGYSTAVASFMANVPDMLAIFFLLLLLFQDHHSCSLKQNKTKENQQTKKPLFLRMAKKKVKPPNDASNGSVFFSQVFNVFYSWQYCKAFADAIKGQPHSFQPSVPTTSSYLTDMCLGYTCIIVTVVMWWKNDHCKAIISKLLKK